MTDLTKTQTALTLSDTAWGTEGTDTSDILIPKILLMQGLSKYVASEKAQMGDLVDSVTGEVLGSGREKDFKPVKIIPIMSYKNWMHHKLVDGKWVYDGMEPWTALNANTPRYEEYEKNGEKYKSDATLNFYVLVEKEGVSLELPYLVSFRRTGYMAGKKLVTHFAKCQLAAKAGKPVPPAGTTFDLFANKIQNDSGTFYVFDVGSPKETKKELVQEAFGWYQTLKAGAHKVDTSDLEAPVDAEGDIGF